MNQIDKIINYIEERRDKLVSEMTFCRKHNYELQILLLRAVEQELTTLRFEILHGDLKKEDKKNV